MVQHKGYSHPGPAAPLSCEGCREDESFGGFTRQMAMMIRLLASQETARQAESGGEVLRVGLSEHHADGSVSFPIEQGDDNNLCVTVTVKPGWK